MSISRRAFQSEVPAYSWEEIFEAGPYYQRVSELLEDAQHYAIFVGWQIDSRLPLPLPYRPAPMGDAHGKTGAPQSSMESLKAKILRLVESKPGLHFYFLMWDHAYFYVLERETWQGRIWDDLHPRVHFLFDNRHPFGGSHHEKLCIIDGTTAFCGGIDLCDERWDSPQHLYTDPRRSLHWNLGSRDSSEHHGPYHDVAVQVKGPICAEIQEHVHRRWRSLSSVPFPRLPTFSGTSDLLEGAHRVYLSRTIAEIEAGSRRSITREIEFLFRDLIQSAEHRIILEGQYYWSEEINDMLVAKVHQMRGKDFEIILVLADTRRLRGLTRQLTIHELKLLDQLETAARIASVKVTIGSPHVHPPLEAHGRSKPIYIHSKVIIIDDATISIGSANLASRALRLDTEVTLTFEARTDAERAHVRKFAQSVLRHWNLPPEASQNSDVHLHTLHASEMLGEREAELSWLGHFIQKHVPWKLFFDPKVPWFHPLDRRFRRLSNSEFPWITATTALLWVLSTMASLSLARLFMSAPIGNWEWLYASILTSVWFAPVPFTGVAILSVFQLGFETGTALSICSLWVAALQGYLLTRIFPTYLTRFYRASGPSWLPKRLGLRQFPATISVSMDPRIMLRSKIAYQGLYCVPIPWFAMNLLLILPSALYVLLIILSAKTPAHAALRMREAAPKILLALMLYSIVRLGGSSFRKWRRPGKGRAP